MHPLAFWELACSAYGYGEVLASLNTVVELDVCFWNGQQEHQPVHAPLLEHGPVQGKENHGSDSLCCRYFTLTDLPFEGCDKYLLAKVIHAH